MKHWTEPNGIFIVNIPIEWQYKNVVFENIEEKSPFSFQPYENSLGCFQLSCYPLEEKGINTNLPLQENNSKIDWLVSRMDDEEFDVWLFHAQVDDLLCMAKYIYDSENRNKKEISEQINKVKIALDSFRVIPKSDRLLASHLNKYDNFQSSLAASYDLLENAYSTNSHIELVVILANQIDAFLRLSIILQQQLENKTNDIKIKYLFQGDNKNGIFERTIYSKAKELGIIDEELFKELNSLYSLRNRVIHRYIISFIKTRDIAKIAYDYTFLNEKTRLILGTIEEKQFETGFGIYGKGYKKDDVFTEHEYRRAISWINDKHLLEKLKRKI
ncbi:hypothetical protein [Labilibaculum sp.]|uniref:hypothetical protein n=1 Tax=Labilibaculum sp. TaxID=2060723 RepID=UPI002AA6D297|nr:hypothetical protein [Labilibaculum sp.]